MAYFTMFYWQYSLAFPISLITVLVIYFCCRMLCLKQVRSENAQTRRNQRSPATAQTQDQQVYTITAVVVPDQRSPPTYKEPNSTLNDLPPSYDEALILHKEYVAKFQQEEQVSPTTQPPNNEHI